MRDKECTTIIYKTGYIQNEEGMTLDDVKRCKDARREALKRSMRTINPQPIPFNPLAYKSSTIA